MNSGMGRFVRNVLPSIVQTQFVPVRYRYYADKIAAGPIIKNYGYKDRVAWSGPLPRLKNAPPLPLPEYCPANPWSSEKVERGKNDYIDILGGGKLKPSQVSYDVPVWLRGKRGNEMKLLILKHKVYSSTKYEYENPTMWHNLGKRIRYLYRFLNYNTKTSYSKY